MDYITHQIPTTRQTPLTASGWLAGGFSRHTEVEGGTSVRVTRCLPAWTEDNMPAGAEVRWRLVGVEGRGHSRKTSLCFSV